MTITYIHKIRSMPRACVILGSKEQEVQPKLQ
jgi:hypothetical protein